jgi:hypothetical protein
VERGRLDVLEEEIVLYNPHNGQYRGFLSLLCGQVSVS